jgi:hypothetical protein
MPISLQLRCPFLTVSRREGHTPLLSAAGNPAAAHSGIEQQFPGFIFQRAVVNESRMEDVAHCLVLRSESNNNPTKRKDLATPVGHDAGFHLFKDFPTDFERSLCRAVAESVLDSLSYPVFRLEQPVQNSHGDHFRSITPASRAAFTISAAAGAATRPLPGRSRIEGILQGGLDPYSF